MPILFAVLLPLGFTASEASSPSITARIVSTDPLIIHIANFITDPEIKHLLRLGHGEFTDSMVIHENGSELVGHERTSFTAFLPSNDSVVERITARASEFQGYTSMKQHESLQLTRYRAGQQYKPHWDWFPVPEAPPSNYSNRLSTFFVILEANCTTCGTRFPDLGVDWTKEDVRWCSIVDCEGKGVITFRPIPGNAVFWKNLRGGGEGDGRTLHAGLPPETGVKTGWNIWTRTDSVV
ncbi:oxidoreductase-like protein [Paraphoma chrysanthemicola]|nr:oxidoreductase-like protein [Paraphoma chrysanthemicola]